MAEVEAKATTADQKGEAPIVGREYFRNPEVNMGFYSKKREGVADVDPKVMEPYKPIPGKPPRKVVIDRQRKLFASLDIEELLAELVSKPTLFKHNNEVEAKKITNISCSCAL